jgi:uncharacterized protein YjbI with pentapeptide repeats
MRVIKPLRLGVLPRVIEARGRCHLAVGVYGFFDFARPDVLRSEQEMWPFVAEVLGAQALDEGAPKSQGEVLVAGKAWNIGAPRAAVDVEVAVGPVRKRLRVIGDRIWRDGAMTEPALFRSMPVTWERAFGGPAFAENPRGVGHAARQGNALPNIEDPRRPLVAPDDRPPPAGFLPVDVSAPSRLARAGTYDAAWVEKRMPGLADDVDWRLFNVAPPDQWLPEFFSGRERFSVLGMHPSRPEVTGRLPAVIARSFATLATPEGERFVEIPMRAETLWLFPEARAGVLIWRGTVRVREDDADDVVNLLIAADAMGAPRPIDHYASVLAKRLDRDGDDLAALREDDLLPPRTEGDEPSTSSEIDAALAESSPLEEYVRRMVTRQHGDLRTKLIAEGIDATNIPRMPPEEPPITMATLAARLEDAEKRAEAARVKADEKREEALREMRASCEAEGMDFDALTTQQGGPPKFSADQHLAELAAIAAQARIEGVPAEGLEAMLADAAFIARVHATEAQIRETYARFAQHLPPAKPLDAARSQAARAMVQQACDLRASLAESDLTGVDLSGMDFSGMDLRAVLLEGANLEDSLFRDTVLEGAVLVRARLDHATLRGANLRRANLGRASLVGATLADADLTEAVLEGADLREANLQGCTLTGAELGEVKLRGASLQRATLDDVTMIEVDLRAANFGEASLKEVVILESQMQGADFARATLTGATFVGVQASDAVFRGASAEGLLIQGESTLANADFTDADLRGANLRGVPLGAARLAGCRLQEADLSRCAMQGATMSLTSAQDARFDRTDLRGADLRGANLLQAILSHADLRGADLSGSNLFRADLARAKVDRDTRFDDALLTQSRVVARLEEP